MTSFSLKNIFLSCGRFFFRYRNALFPVIFISLPLLSRPALFMGNATLDQLVLLVGTLIALAGAGFRLFVIGYAYIKRGGQDGQVYADELVVAGVFSHIRNPMYVGNFLIMLGLCIMYGSAVAYFVLIPFFSLVYYSIILAEEDYLANRFGEAYARYAATVPRFIPNFKGMRKSLAGYTYDWRKVIRKDYGTFFGTLLGIESIRLWKIFVVSGVDGLKPTAALHSVIYITGGIAYLLIRYFKKTGKLASPQNKSE